ncbi:MAG: hypothetical protein ACFFEY_02785 [Candidatus Thorarchaeota archaeon]
MSLPVVFMQLSSCWGCHQSLLDAHFEVLPFLSELQIVYWPTIMDIKSDTLLEKNEKSIEVGFIEGVVRTEEDKLKVKLMRQKCNIIVAFGACACYGSIAGLANLYEMDELVARKFRDIESIEETNSEEPKLNLPKFEDFIYNVKDLIHVDLFIPGCPPKTENIIATLLYIVTRLNNGPKSRNRAKSVCNNCNLFYEGCFLDQGKLCFGPITASGCELMCPNNSNTCYGCFEYTLNPDEKALVLQDLIIDLEEVNVETSRTLRFFLISYLGLSNLTSFYFRKDLLQRLAYEPESFIQIEKKTKNGFLSLLKVNPSGVIINDEIIGRILYLLKNSPNFKFSTKTVCSHCDRIIVDKVPTKLKRDYDGLSTTDKCFLEQGYICLGLVTHAGCGTICPNKANAPCLGCYGPPVGTKDQGPKFISSLGSLCLDINPEEITNSIKDPAGLFNRFTLADSILKHKYYDHANET